MFLFSKLLELVRKRKDFFTRSFISNLLVPFTSLILINYFFLSNAFVGDGAFALWMDNEFFLGTVFNSMGRSLRNFEFPLRIDSVLGGIPLYNFTQVSAFYPFYFTALPIFNGPIDAIYSLHWITIFHILVLEVNMYVFLRIIGASALAALTGAALFTFSANSVIYVSWITLAAPYAWLPLYLAGLVGILKFPGLTRYSLMALVGIVFLTLASPSQPLIHAVFMTIIVVSAFSLNQFRIGRGSEIPYALITVAVISFLALLLTAPTILPAVLEFKHMVRFMGHFPSVVGNSRIPFEAFHYDQLSVADLGGVFFKLKSHAEVGNQFTGIIVIALASVATVVRRKSWIVVALAFIGIYSLISSFGINLGFAYLNYNIPLLNKIREPSRFLVLFQFAICVLAALGIDELGKFISRKGNEENERPIWFALLAAPVSALIALPFINEQIASKVSSLVSFLVLVSLVFLTWLAIRFRFWWLNNKMIIVLWSVVALIILAIEVPWIPTPVSVSQFLQKEGPSLDMAIQRVVALDPYRNYRVIFDGRIDKQQAAMHASYRNVRTLNAYFNPLPKSQFEQLYYHGPRADNYFRILGAKYLICRECDEASTKEYKFLETVAGYEIYEAEEVLPHSYIVHESKGEFRDLEDFITKAANVDLRKGLLYFESGTHVELRSDSNVTSNPCVQSEEIALLNRKRFVLQCKVPGVIVMNEFFDKAWVVTVDGSKVKSLKVNGNQIGVSFTAGAHVIEFRYRPTNFIISIILMIFGFAILILLIVAGLWMKNVSECNRK